MEGLLACFFFDWDFGRKQDLPLSFSRTLSLFFLSVGELRRTRNEASLLRVLVCRCQSRERRERESKGKEAGASLQERRHR